ncbi:cyclic-AMP phosphodiesterase [Ameyamaea chiangmaiensis NBRC 103196]|uniref:3',5'-cyclic-nucleotide phosphodiesterase n=1 Tax=Ameyamaea chiangmaiensis TaxID=442969 RepID=A0A850PG59_9PROT|nr:3',5'-cyclic-nucleotide phosphodiesterase [Ameyamaea chiangmaiensis]MBS4075013.1 3',5'-cyclic-nucleotide phosphodiesterase [Ameyamaea chiangmaiensis]NVN41420.1 3',5'-cyclic-nucleotide phosphodiesterase [Ameyamaea chiangmaiensis]GBQ65782.1 cyclic-AMP phosphodiesterase [Ameyamaea chiangmaiensis NBRC 103196]
MRRLGRAVLALLVAIAAPTVAWAGPGFDLVVLGARGGIEDGNLSTYLVRPHGAGRYVACDAGTVVAGLRAADDAHAFDDLPLPASPQSARIGAVLHDWIAGYLISHAHLDHVAGLVIASPDDRGKTIHALPSVIGVMQRDLFNNALWPNLADGGPAPAIGLYHYDTLSPGVSVPVMGTGLRVTPFPLEHGGVESTAFVLQADADALLYLGDTGADRVQGSHRLRALWHAVAPLVRQHRLRGIIIEASYDNARSTNQLYGHLTPALMLASLGDLALAAGGPASLRGLPVVVAHVKYALTDGEAPTRRILSELEQSNTLGLRFIMPEQGMRIRF